MSTGHQANIKILIYGHFCRIVDNKVSSGHAANADKHFNSLCLSLYRSTGDNKVRECSHRANINKYLSSLSMTSQCSTDDNTVGEYRPLNKH